MALSMPLIKHGCWQGLTGRYGAGERVWVVVQIDG